MALFDVDRRDGIATLIYRRPPKNVMSRLAMTELVSHLEAIANDPEVTVVLLTGGIDGFFIAHADFEDLAAIARGEQPPGEPNAIPRAYRLLESMPQPTVAAIDGQAWGGGLECALSCTMRIGSERAHVALPEVSAGVIPGGGGTQRLPRLIGPARAAEMVLTGRIVKAAEAERLGVLNAVLPTEGFLDHARAWCQKINRHSGAAVAAAKRALVEGQTMALPDGIAFERAVFEEINRSPAAQARNAAMTEPR